MTIPKQYLHDRLILLVFSVNTFLFFLLTVLTFIRLDTSHSSYIVQYRQNLAIDKFRSGSSTELYLFIVFGLLVLLFHTIISFRLFLIHRQLAVIALGLGTLLLLITIIVSYSLLSLR